MKKKQKPVKGWMMFSDHLDGPYVGSNAETRQQCTARWAASHPYYAQHDYPQRVLITPIPRTRT